MICNHILDDDTIRGFLEEFLQPHSHTLGIAFEAVYTLLVVECHLCSLLYCLWSVVCRDALRRETWGVLGGRLSAANDKAESRCLGSRTRESSASHRRRRPARAGGRAGGLPSACLHRPAEPLSGWPSIDNTSITCPNYGH